MLVGWGYAAEPQVYAKLEWDYSPDVTVWSNSTGIVNVVTNDFGPLTSIVGLTTNKSTNYIDILSTPTNTALAPVYVGTNRYVVSVMTTNGIRSDLSKELIGTRKKGMLTWK